MVPHPTVYTQLQHDEEILFIRSIVITQFIQIKAKILQKYVELCRGEKWRSSARQGTNEKPLRALFAEHFSLKFPYLIKFAEW